MASSTKLTIRCTFTYAASDTSITNWITAQRNLSSSIRRLIKDYVVRHGLTDVSDQNSMIVSPDENTMSVLSQKNQKSLEEGQVTVEANQTVSKEEQNASDEELKNTFSKDNNMDSMAAAMLVDMLK